MNDAVKVVGVPQVRVEEPLLGESAYMMSVKFALEALEGPQDAQFICELKADHNVWFVEPEGNLTKKIERTIHIKRGHHIHRQEVNIAKGPGVRVLTFEVNQKLVDVTTGKILSRANSLASGTHGTEGGIFG
jgi:hypothetical protein